MTIALPPPIAAYYNAKNRHDIDGMLAPFADDALVHDEGHDHRGRADIRGWMEGTTRKYRVTSTPEESSTKGAELIVRALVSGNFPRSPAHLTYRFVLANDRIARLMIG